MFRPMLQLYPLARPLLFLLPPETAHQVTITGLSVLGALPGRIAPPRFATRQVMGLEFPNPVGLAAGLDKDGEAVAGLFRLGFGFVELGTVTPRPQPGNPAPRLFRLPQAQALINRMGFNNHGVEALAARLAHRPPGLIVGVNLGRNKDTPNEQALDDYRAGMQAVYRLSDYLVVNLSSPNTPGLRALQAVEPLTALLTGLLQERARLAEASGLYRPLLVKLAPDLDEASLRETAHALRGLREGESGLDGVIATNTTTDRAAVAGLEHAAEAGGLSGAPLSAKAQTVIEQLAEVLNGRMALIAAGGIMSGADAAARLRAGADLVQIYTGLIYRGPGLIGEIRDQLEAH